MNELGGGDGAGGGVGNWLIRVSRRYAVVVVDLLDFTSEGDFGVPVVVVRRDVLMSDSYWKRRHKSLLLVLSSSLSLLDNKLSFDVDYVSESSISTPDQQVKQHSARQQVPRSVIRLPMPSKMNHNMYSKLKSRIKVIGYFIIAEFV